MSEYITPTAQTDFMDTHEILARGTEVVRNITAEINGLSELGLLSRRTVISATADLSVMAIRLTEAAFRVTDTEANPIQLDGLVRAINILRREAEEYGMELPDLSFPWEAGEEE